MTLTRRCDGTSLIAPGRPPIPAVYDPSGFRLGIDQPTWDNSGCRIAQPQLTQNNTLELITTADGQIIEGLHLPQGRIQVRHRNVTIRDCLINIGPWSGKDSTISRNYGVIARPGLDTTGLRIEHVTIDPINAAVDGTADDAGVYGIQAPTGLIYRCAIRRVTDAVSHEGLETMHALGNYLATRWLASDPYAQGGTPTHNDGIQISGGSGHRVIGNTIVSYSSDGVSYRTDAGLGVALTPYRGLLDSIEISQNWFYGGETHISAWPRYNEGGPAITNLTVWGNRHGAAAKQHIIITDAGSATARRLESGTAAAGGFTDQYGTWPEGATLRINVWRNNTGTGAPA